MKTQVSEVPLDSSIAIRRRITKPVAVFTPQVAGTNGSMTPADRAVVLGFDGIPWRLVRRWADQGELPHFAELFDGGAAAPLESTTPPTTPMAWPSLATGVGPHKHGIYGFHRLTSNYTHRMNTSEQVRAPPLWNLLEPSAVGNVPMTYPATEFDGQLVAGMMAPTIDERFTHPPDLAATVRDIPGYRIGLDWSDYGDRQDAFLDDLDSLIGARRELMRRFLDDNWRLLFFVYTAPDRLQHLVWDESVLLEYYRTFDDILGEVMAEVADDRCNLFVVSDHGFGPISKFVHVNTYLEQAGFITRKQSRGGRGVFERLGLTKSRVLRSLERVGIDDETLVRYVPAPVVNAVADRVPGEHVLHDVDFERTTAFLHGPGHVYLNGTERFDGGTVLQGEREEYKGDLETVLSEWTDPATGEQVLNVHDGASLFPTDPHAPDLVVAGRDGYQVRMSLSPSPLMDTGATAAYHRSQGIFFAWGHDIAPGIRPNGATVVDLAPTVLHSLAEPVPRETDGRVLGEIFAPQSVPSRRSIETFAPEPTANRESTERDLGSVEERLRGLGYLE